MFGLIISYINETPVQGVSVFVAISVAFVFTRYAASVHVTPEYVQLAKPDAFCHEVSSISESFQVEPVQYSLLYVFLY